MLIVLKLLSQENLVNSLLIFYGMRYADADYYSFVRKAEHSVFKNSNLV